MSKAFVEKIGKALGSPGSGLRIMGTGPYKITSFPSSTAATVERFDGYWGEAAGAELHVQRASPTRRHCSWRCQSGQAAAR